MTELSIQEKVLIKEFEAIDEQNDVVTNREVFYLMRNHKPYHFKTQDDCDTTLAKLIELKKIDISLIYEDNFYKFNSKLKTVMKNIY